MINEKSNHETVRYIIDDSPVIKDSKTCSDIITQYRRNSVLKLQCLLLFWFFTVVHNSKVKCNFLNRSSPDSAPPWGQPTSSPRSSQIHMVDTPFSCKPRPSFDTSPSDTSTWVHTFVAKRIPETRPQDNKAFSRPPHSTGGNSIRCQCDLRSPPESHRPGTWSHWSDTGDPGRCPPCTLWPPTSGRRSWEFY